MTDNARKLPTPTLMLVTDRRLAGGEGALVRAVAEAVEGGVNVVQLREKDLAPAELLPLARRLRKVTAGRALLLVNGPLEVALQAGADGVHLPEDAPAHGWPDGPSGGPEPHGLIIGRSVHSPGAARRALAEGVDYLIAGPVYKTASHPGRPEAGLEIIRKVVSVSPVPVIGIGGITAENARAVLEAGASGVAIISAVLGTGAPEGCAAALRCALAAPRQSAPQFPSGDTAMTTTGITLNGKPHPLESGRSVMRLLESLNINPRQVAVALNGEVVPRDSWIEVEIEDGDAVEIVRAVGGGCG